MKSINLEEGKNVLKETEIQEEFRTLVLSKGCVDHKGVHGKGLRFRRSHGGQKREAI